MIPPPFWTTYSGAPFEEGTEAVVFFEDAILIFTSETGVKQVQLMVERSWRLRADP